MIDATSHPAPGALSTADEALTAGTTGTAASPVITGQWLVRFRWAVVFGAALTLTVAWSALGLRFPVAIVAATLAIQFASNLWLALHIREDYGARERTLAVIVLLDVLLLTVLLLTTGGPSNPFTISYLVYITLAAVILRAFWTQVVTAACMVGYGSLFVTALRAPFDEHAAHAATQPAMGHQVGMWVAFLVAAALTATFVTRIRLELEAREQALQVARRLAAKQERLASLTTLAAGAAHELATPLATIATAAVELELALTSGNFPDAIAEDARLVRRQVERCRDILDQMSGRAAPSVAQVAQPLDVGAIVQHALAGMSRAEQAQVDVAIAPDLPTVRLPLEASARVIRSLIKNALYASTAQQRVTVTVDSFYRTVRIRVHDDGAGMTPETLARAGEPFFTTRPAGAGFGLGLFLVRTFADQWHGQFEISSAPAQGTTAVLHLPIAQS